MVVAAARLEVDGIEVPAGLVLAVSGFVTLQRAKLRNPITGSQGVPSARRSPHPGPRGWVRPGGKCSAA